MTVKISLKGPVIGSPNSYRTRNQEKKGAASPSRNKDIPPRSPIAVLHCFGIVQNGSDMGLLIPEHLPLHNDHDMPPAQSVWIHLPNQSIPLPRETRFSATNCWRMFCLCPRGNFRYLRVIASAVRFTPVDRSNSTSLARSSATVSMIRTISRSC